MSDIPSAFLPPWPEWNDNEVNNEKWNPEGGSPNKSALKQKNEPQKEILSFEDPCGHGVLPPEFEVIEWRRPREINPNVNFSVISNTNVTGVSDVFSRNIHLLGSEIMQSLLMSILWLEKIGELSPFLVEFQGPKFQFPQTTWKPWHHVYSNCKITKGVVHKPEYNSYGKYVVRVFFIGMWRRITVDDYLPIDLEGNVLLPLAKDPRDLWLPLLSKALLRIIMIPDMSNVVTNLTGWFHLSINCSFIDQDPMWRAFVRLKGKNVESSESHPGMCITSDSDHCVHDSVPILCASLTSPLIIMDFQTSTEHNGKYHAVSSMVYEIYDDEQFIKAKEEILKKRWKEFRWRKWAVKHGIIKDTDKYPGRKILLFGPMFCAPVDFPNQTIDESVANTLTDKEYFNIYLLHELTEKLRLLRIYYKPSDFEYTFNILDINDIFLTKADGKKDKKSGSKKDDKGSAKTKSARSQNQNEPAPHLSGCFYIVSDSLFCKTIYINCSGFSEVEKIDSNCFFVVGEKFSWKLVSMGKFIFSVQNYGSSTVHLLLGPGLQAVRVWYSLPSNYCILMVSKTPFTLNRKETVQELLAMASITEKSLATTASNSFKTLMESTESPVTHGNALKEFLESLQPVYFSKLLASWNERFTKRLQILEAFEEITIEMMLQKLESIDLIKKTLFTFRKLFLNPKFGKKSMRKVLALNPNLREKFGLDDTISLDYQVGEMEKFVPAHNDIPQVKTDKKSTKSGKKENAKDENVLLDVPENVISLLRKLIEKCPDVQKYYPFNACVSSQLSYVEYNGNTEINLSGNTLFLIRYIFNVSNENAMPFAFHIFTAMPKLIVTIINNDTQEELPSGLSENSTYFLSQNMFGYTVFAYGEYEVSPLVPKQTEMPWKLRILGSVEHSLPYLFSPFSESNDVPPPTIIPLHFEGLYLPEKDNIFCRCVLNVLGNAVVTLHIIASSDSACITLRVKGNKQKCLAEAEGVHEVIIPVVILNSCDGIPNVDGEGVIFTVEGHVVKESWSFSEETIAALRYLREMRNEAGVKRFKKSSKKASIANIPGAELLPSWLLSAIFDTVEVANCHLLPDTQSEDEIRRQKESWVSGDEVRRLKGTEIKNEFLAQFPDDYFLSSIQKIGLLQHKLTSNVSISTKSTRSTLSMTDISQAVRTESMMTALSQHPHYEYKMKSKYAIPDITLGEMIEDSHQNLGKKLSRVLQFEEHLQNKFTLAEKSFANVSEYKKQIVKQMYESVLPPKPLKKEKTTAASKL